MDQKKLYGVFMHVFPLEAAGEGVLGSDSSSVEAVSSGAEDLDGLSSVPGALSWSPSKRTAQ